MSSSPPSPVSACVAVAAGLLALACGEADSDGGPPQAPDQGTGAAGAGATDPGLGAGAQVSDGAGGGAAGGGSGAAGSTNASNVTFGWPEGTLASGSCEPGVYTGQFTCAYAQGVDCAANTGGLPFTGPIAITLVPSENGEFLEVSDGTLSGESAGFVFGGPITGELSCLSRFFEGGTVGKYDLAGAGAFGGDLYGPLTAVYEPQPPSLVNGTWCMTMTQPGTPQGDPCAQIPTGQPGSCLVGSCKGGWQAVLTP